MFLLIGQVKASWWSPELSLKKGGVDQGAFGFALRIGGLHRVDEGNELQTGADKVRKLNYVGTPAWPGILFVFSREQQGTLTGCVLRFMSNSQYQKKNLHWPCLCSSP